MELAVVVIPISTQPLTYLERISLKQVHRILKNYPKVFVAPRNFTPEYGTDYENYKLEYFEECYFGSTDAHNNLLTSSKFYERFRNYEFMLIYHLDAFVFSDQLKKFCAMKYDYIAAPSLKEFKLHNETFPSLHGGFSLRRVNAFLRVLFVKQNEIKTWTMAEDIFYSRCGYELDNFLIAPKSVALEFSFEAYARQSYQMNKQRLPFGCHAWWKRDFLFYKPFIEMQGYSLDNFYIGYEESNLDYENRKERAYRYVFSRLLRTARYRKVISEILYKTFGEEVSFAIFGSGTDGRDFYEKMHEFIKIECFFDNAKSKWGKKIYGLPVCEFNDSLVKKRNIVIFVCTTYFRKKICNQLHQLGLIVDIDFVDWNDFQKMVVKKVYPQKPSPVMVDSKGR